MATKEELSEIIRGLARRVTDYRRSARALAGTAMAVMEDDRVSPESADQPPDENKGTDFTGPVAVWSGGGGEGVWKVVARRDSDSINFATSGISHYGMSIPETKKFAQALVSALTWLRKQKEEEENNTMTDPIESTDPTDAAQADDTGAQNQATTWDVGDGSYDDLDEADQVAVDNTLSGGSIPASPVTLPSGLVVTEAWLSNERENREGTETGE